MQWVSDHGAETRSAYQVGDVVKLVSGGPNMSVVSTGAGRIVDCMWWQGAGYAEGRFPAKSLVLVPHV